MKPDILNSNNKLSLKDAIANYLRKAHGLYMLVLQDMGATNLDEKVDCIVTAPNGEITNLPMTAGMCATRYLYRHKRYQKPLNAIISAFEKECPCEQEAIDWLLGELEVYVDEVGSEISDVKEWLEPYSKNESCDKYMD